MNRVLVSFSIILLLLGHLSCSSENRRQGEKKATAIPGKKGLGTEGGFQISDGDRCPVCAMNAKQDGPFTSAIEIDGGDAYYFCGTGCMIKSWLHPEVYLGVTSGRLKRAVTRDYFKGEYVDALDVFWVAGSDVVGPMGPALVPLAGKADVQAFTKRHGGKPPFSLKGLDDASFERITGKRALKHK